METCRTQVDAPSRMHMPLRCPRRVPDICPCHGTSTHVQNQMCRCYAVPILWRMLGGPHPVAHAHEWARQRSYTLHAQPLCFFTTAPHFPASHLHADQRLLESTLIFGRHEGLLGPSGPPFLHFCTHLIPGQQSARRKSLSTRRASCPMHGMRASVIEHKAQPHAQHTHPAHAPVAHARLIV